jgi:hypothetical protein
VTISIYSLFVRLVDEIGGLLDFAVEVVEVGHVGLDLLDWQLDEHTGDLWGSLVSNHRSDEWEDSLSDLLLKVWVLLGHGWQESSADLHELHNHWVGTAGNGLWSHWHAWLWWHLLGHWGLWWHHALWNTWHSTHTGSHWWLLHWHAWGHVVSWWELLATWSLLGVEWSSVSLTTLTSAHHASLRLVEVSVHGLVLLHDVQQLLKDLGHVWMGGQVGEGEWTLLLGLILLEIGLVDGVLDLNLSLLLKLVVVDHEGLSIIGGVVEGLLGKGGGVWLLEADESEAAVSTLLQLDVLDGTELLEEVLEIVGSPGVWEVLHVEIASLLGSLVSEGVSLLLKGSVGLLHGWSHVELELVAHFLAVETVDGLLGALWSVLLADSLGVIKADESVLTNVVLEKDKRFDVAVSGEHSLDLSVSLFRWNVLDVNIVVHLSERSSVLWLESHSDDFWIVFGELDSLVGSGLILEADETVASGAMVRIERHLKTLDLSESLEFLLEVRMLEVLWHGLDEDIVGKELLLVGSEELLVKLEGSALLSFDLEVLHGLASLVEGDWVLDAHNGGVEWVGDVLLDLGLLVKKDVGLFLKSDGDLSGIGLISWEIVQVDEVLLLFTGWIVHLFFVFRI